MAFGENTQDIITLNLPPNWTSTVVKISLCIGLFFTFPIMLIPVYEIIERGLLVKVTPLRRAITSFQERVGVQANFCWSPSTRLSRRALGQGPAWLLLLMMTCVR